MHAALRNYDDCRLNYTRHCCDVVSRYLHDFWLHVVLLWRSRGILPSLPHHGDVQAVVKLHPASLEICAREHRADVVQVDLVLRPAIEMEVLCARLVGLLTIKCHTSATGQGVVVILHTHGRVHDARGRSPCLRGNYLPAACQVPQQLLLLFLGKWHGAGWYAAAKRLGESVLLKAFAATRWRALELQLKPLLS